MFNNKEELLLIQQNLKSIQHKLNTQSDSLKGIYALLYTDVNSITSQLNLLKEIPEAVERQEIKLTKAEFEIEKLKERAAIVNKLLGAITAAIIAITIPNLLTILINESATRSDTNQSTAKSAATRVQ